MNLKITQYSFVHGTESDQRLSVVTVRQSVATGTCVIESSVIESRRCGGW